MICPICQKTITSPAVMSGGHLFHKACLNDQHTEPPAGMDVVGRVSMDAAPFEAAVVVFDDITNRFIKALAISAEIQAMDAFNASHDGDARTRPYQYKDFMKRAEELRKLAAHD